MIVFFGPAFRRTFFIVMLLWVIVCRANAETAPPILVGLDNGLLLLDVHAAPLGLVLKKLEQKCSVTVSGLDHRYNEPITFHAENVPLDLGIKRLFRYLGETSYAFKFSREQLRFVSVIQESKANVTSAIEPGDGVLPTMALTDNTGHNPPLDEHSIQAYGDIPGAVKLGPDQNPGMGMGKITDRKEDQEYTTAPLVLEVMSESQAAEIELLKGDLILEYDGQRVKNSRELVQQVKQKPEDQEVDLVVLRNGETIDFVLNGGLIGVKIRTERIQKKALEALNLE